MGRHTRKPVRLNKPSPKVRPGAPIVVKEPPLTEVTPPWLKRYPTIVAAIVGVGTTAAVPDTRLGLAALAFLSIDGLYEAVGGEKRNPAKPQFTDHYFTGDYPTRLLDKDGEAMGNKLSVMVSHG